MLRSGGVEPILLPPRSPNLNALAETWVRSIKTECLSKLILFGEPSLRRTITEYLEPYHHEHAWKRLLTSGYPERLKVAHRKTFSLPELADRLRGDIRPALLPQSA